MINAIHDEDIHAYADGLVGDDDKRRALEEHLRRHPEDARRVDTYRRQNALIRQLAAHRADTSPAPALKTMFGMARVKPRFDRWRGAVMAGAAGLVIGAGAGGYLGGYLGLPAEMHLRAGGADPDATATTQGSTPGLRLQAFQPIPDLDAEGLHFVGSHLSQNADGTHELRIDYADPSNTALQLSITLRPETEQKTIQVHRDGATTNVKWSAGPFVYEVKSRLPDRKVVAVAASLATQGGSDIMLSSDPVQTPHRQPQSVANMPGPLPVPLPTGGEGTQMAGADNVHPAAALPVDTKPPAPGVIILPDEPNPGR